MFSCVYARKTRGTRIYRDMEDDNTSPYCTSGEKFLELAEWDIKTFKEHVQEYDKQVFASDKIRVLDRALEYATRAIELQKKGIAAREDRKNVYDELNKIISNGTNQRYKVLLFLTAADIPYTKTQIAKAVFNDTNKISTVDLNTRMFEKYGILKNTEKGIQLDPEFRDILFTTFKATLLTALEEVCLKK